MLERQRAVVAAVLSLFLQMASCALHNSVARSYRLVNRGGSLVLIPPGIASPDIVRRTIDVDAGAGSGPCPRDGAIAIRSSPRRIRVTVRREALLNKPPGWLNDQAAALETTGCLVPGSALKLAVRIAEALPLDPNQAFRLLYPAAEADLLPVTRVQTVTPLLRSAASGETILDPVQVSGGGNSLTLTITAPSNLIGYETAWYTVETSPARAGVAITPLSAERTLNGATEHLARPTVNYFQFAPEAALYRLFYKQDPTDLTAWVVAGRSPADLNQRTRSLAEGAVSCVSLSPAWCRAIPKSAAINVFLPINVNGREVLISWGGSVGDAIRASGEPAPQSILPRLHLSRLYDGRAVPVRFEPGSAGILRMVLMGGEVITWK